MSEHVRPWRAAWTDALYGENGFYRRAEGPRGHFETSANAPGGEVDVLAEALVRLASRYRCRLVVDVGAGRGELAAAVAGQGLDVLGVDVVPRPAGLPAGIGWLESPGGPELPAELDGLEAALVVANEWLDVVPCDVLQTDAEGRLRVVEVARDGTERLGEQAPADLVDWSRRWWPTSGKPPGARVEVGRARDAAWRDLVGRVRSGLVLAMDYGHSRPARPPEGTLSAHRAGRLVPPVPDGTCDLTAAVAWDSVMAASPAATRPRLTTQRAALTELGVEGSRPATALGHPSYLLQLRRAGAAATLLDPGGLGGLGWLACPVGIGQPEPRPWIVET
jgi:SAM-dependent MidA family methyltransferase